MGSTVTVSSKYQIVIPKEVRESIPIKPGQKLAVLVKHGRVTLVPVLPIEELRGMLKGVKVKDFRDESDRF